MTVDAIVEQIEKLPKEERFELLERLDELYPETIELSEGMQKLLEAREAEAEANPEVGYSWEEVEAYVKRK